MRHASVSVAAAMLLLLAGLAFWPSSPRGPLPATSQAVAQDAKGTKEPAKEVPTETAKSRSSKDENNARTEAWLSSRRIEAKFDETPVLEVIEYVSAMAADGAKETSVQFYVDRKQVDDAGADAKINLKLRSVRLDMLLDLALKQAELGYFVDDGIVIVTTQAEIDTRMEVRVYNCSDLLELPRPKRTRTTTPPGAKTSGGQGGGFFSTPSSDLDAFRVQFGGGAGETPPAGGGGAGALGADGAGAGLGSPVAGEDVELIDVLRTNIKPESWKEAGGPGDVSEYRGLLIVSQTAEVHRRIEQLLELLRATAKEKPAVAGERGALPR